MHKISTTLLTIAVGGLLATGCSAVDQAADDATNAVKDAGNEATDAAKAQATDAIKDEASKALDGNIKINPNDISEGQIALGLQIAGIDNGDELAKELKAAGPYTNENLESKVTDTLKDSGLSEDQMKKLLSMLEVPEEGATN